MATVGGVTSVGLMNELFDWNQVADDKKHGGPPIRDSGSVMRR